MSRYSNSYVPLILDLTLELLVVVNEILKRELDAFLQLLDSKILVLLRGLVTHNQRLHSLKNEESESFEVAFHKVLMECN